MGNVQTCIFNSNGETCSCSCLCGTAPPHCPNPYCEAGGYWQCDSPILIDTLGEGFHLTSAALGVFFDLWADGQGRMFAWTDPSYHNAWLALDRNYNGRIDNGSELFGSATPQPAPDGSGIRNGFNALAVYDQPANGGNGDGIISAADAIYKKLILWVDENHDGISQTSELHSLPEFHVDSISLDYTRSRWVDQYGNSFSFKARVRDASGKRGRDRFAWDVFLTTVE